MQYPLSSRAGAAVLLVLFIASAAAGGAPGPLTPIALPRPLRSVPVPEPAHLGLIVAGLLVIRLARR